MNFQPDPWYYLLWAYPYYFIIVPIWHGLKKFWHWLRGK